MGMGLWLQSLWSSGYVGGFSKIGQFGETWREQSEHGSSPRARTWIPKDLADIDISWFNIYFHPKRIMWGRAHQRREIIWAKTSLFGFWIWLSTVVICWSPHNSDCCLLPPYQLPVLPDFFEKIPSSHGKVYLLTLRWKTTTKFYIFRSPWRKGNWNWHQRILSECLSLSSKTSSALQMRFSAQTWWYSRTSILSHLTGKTIISSFNRKDNNINTKQQDSTQQICSTFIRSSSIHFWSAMMLSQKSILSAHHGSLVITNWSPISRYFCSSGSTGSQVIPAGEPGKG